MLWALVCSSSACDGGDARDRPVWSESERALLRSLSLAALGPPPPSPSNRVADDPRAASLGERLFFDPRLSRNGRIACRSCHEPDHYFTDQRPTSHGLGPTRRNAPTVVAAAYSPWQFWDGRRDSLWAQALAPLETPEEHGSTRLSIVRSVTGDAAYAADYRALFGEPPPLGDATRFPEHAGPFGDDEARAAWQRLEAVEREAIDRAFANIGKCLAAYERTLRPGVSRFDRFVAALTDGSGGPVDAILSPDEQAGARLFLDVARTRCLQCHNGPLLTNHGFHDIGTGRRSTIPDLGRFLGVESVRLDVFNCLGPYSDAPAEACDALRFLDFRRDPRLIGAFRTPGLRGLTQTAPYFHDGSAETLAEVVEYYRSPPRDPPNELTPLDLDESEARQLVAFLATLSASATQAPIRHSFPMGTTISDDPRSDARFDPPRPKRPFTRYARSPTLEGADPIPRER